MSSPSKANVLVARMPRFLRRAVYASLEREVHVLAGALGALGALAREAAPTTTEKSATRAKKTPANAGAA
jgi:hypothetical protein